MIERVDEGIWLAAGRTVSFYGFPYPTRSVIVRLSNRDLWIWSPIELTSDLRQSVDAVGPVRHLVSPNKLHHLYLQDWKAAYPEARLWGPRSTVRKRSDLDFHGVLEDSPPDEWLPDIDQAWFRGSFAMDEIVFCHRPSATAIVADLIQTFSPEFRSMPRAAYCELCRTPNYAERVRDNSPKLQCRRPLCARCLRPIRHSLVRHSASRKSSRRSLGWKRVRLPRSYGLSFARAFSLSARCACR